MPQDLSRTAQQILDIARGGAGSSGPGPVSLELTLQQIRAELGGGAAGTSPQDASRTALQILDLLDGGTGKAGAGPVSLEWALQRILARLGG